MNIPLNTVIVAPLTSVQKENYPMRIGTQVNHKTGWIMLDQLRTVDKKRLKGKKKFRQRNYSQSQKCYL